MQSLEIRPRELGLQPEPHEPTDGSQAERLNGQSTDRSSGQRTVKFGIVRRAARTARKQEQADRLAPQAANGISQDVA